MVNDVVVVVVVLVLFMQWLIQDFPKGGVSTPKIAIIFQIFAENYMKMKEFRPPGGGARPWCPLGSANVMVVLLWLMIHWLLLWWCCSWWYYCGCYAVVMKLCCAVAVCVFITFFSCPTV